MEYRIFISIDILANLKNICIDIDIDKDILENIHIDINIEKEILENIDIEKEILENIDIEKEILENIDIELVRIWHIERGYLPAVAPWLSCLKRKENGKNGDFNQQWVGQEGYATCEE